MPKFWRKSLYEPKKPEQKPADPPKQEAVAAREERARKLYKVP